MKRILLVFLALTSSVAAQKFEADPTAGLALPMTPLAGDQDASAVVVNPAGLGELAAWHLETAFTGLAGDRPESDGGGFGFYAAAPLALPFLPRMGLGVGFEKLAPPRQSRVPDAGRPFRSTLAYALRLRSGLSLGASWHHFGDDASIVVDGLDSFDAGVGSRFGAYLAAGLVVRNLLAPVVHGTATERRYDGELVTRPLGDDRLELALGLAVGERRGGSEPRLRLSLRVARGAWLRAQVEARTLFTADESARTWDGRASLGLEVSLGGGGAGAYLTGSLSPGGTARVAGGTVVARWSGERLPPLQGHGEHVARVKIGGDPTEKRLAELLAELRRLELDDEVRGVFLHIDGLAAGWATIQELRDAVTRLRARRKPVFAYLVAGSTRDYYLAAAASKVYLDAGGGLRLLGLASSAMYLKEAFDKLGVLAQFEKIEEYKSAPEMFTRDSPSAPAKEMREAILDDVYARLLGDVARDRHRPEADLRRMFENGPYTAAEAGQQGIVDAVVEPRDVDRLLAVELGDIYPVTDSEPGERANAWERPQIAVVVLEGDIVDGKSVEVPLVGQRLAGGDTIAASIAWARDNPRVEAIVLRINSPGGSALASEVIAREVFATRGKKPIIVSLGDVAASGGYFAAAGGDVILADPSTITGSIGIFTGKFDLSALLHRLGITWDTTRRGAHADMESYLRPYTDEERVLIKQKLRFYYGRFVSAVARGRGLDEAQVDAVGRGHVWTGTQARERRLIDGFGGLSDAVTLAKQRAGLDESDLTELVFLPLAPNPLQEILQLAGVGSAAEMPAAWRALLQILPASLLVEPDAVQARLPFTLVDE